MITSAKNLSNPTNNTNVKVSVCCATYNHVNYISQALDSILSQECPFGYEILIYDDASNDGTSSIINEYKEKFPQIIKLIRENENKYSQGVRVNFKYNFPRAKGDYIAFCEGDDIWTDPNKLSKQVKVMEDNPNAVISYHNVLIIDESAPDLIRTSHPSQCNYSSFDLLIGNCYIPTVSIMFRNIKDIIWDELPFHGILGGDLVFQSILGQYGSALYIDSIHPSIYRKHPGGAWSSLSAKRKTYEGVLNRIAICRYYNICNNKKLEKLWVDHTFFYLLSKFSFFYIVKVSFIYFFKKTLKIISRWIK